MEVDFIFLHKEKTTRFNVEWPDWRGKFVEQALEKAKKDKEKDDIQAKFSNLNEGGFSNWLDEIQKSNSCFLLTYLQMIRGTTLM